MASTSRRRRNRKKRRNKILIFFFLLLFLGVGYYYYSYPGKAKELLEDVMKVEPKLKVVNENSKTRPIAVMIDTSEGGRVNHTGLQDAYLTYEIITEGGITRMMVLFKDQDTKVIGPVRSSRHYFLDYAMENDAIYAHYGYSDRAKEDIISLDIDNLNGITNASSAYMRDQNLYAPHNVFTSIEKLKKAALDQNYKLNSEKGLVLNYSVEEIKLNDEENGVIANKVEIPFSYYHQTSYDYNSKEKVYYRSFNEDAHIDLNTGKQYHVKNIIIAKVRNYSFDDYGRQELENIGTGTGYFITNGYAIPITWEKTSRESKTRYKKISGEEIKVNDGNTAIEIEPIEEEPAFLE